MSVVALLVGIFSGVTTYFVLYKVLFENYDEFAGKLKQFFIWFPVSVLFDYVSGKDSLRVWLWLPSGFLVGVIVRWILL